MVSRQALALALLQTLKPYYHRDLLPFTQFRFLQKGDQGICFPFIRCFGRLICRVMYLSKMTTAILDHLDYIVDASVGSWQKIYPARDTLPSRPRRHSDPCRRAAILANKNSIPLL